MFEHKKIQDPDDFFVELSGRKDKCVYFYRINGYNQKINAFIQKYYEAARTKGAVVEGKLQNPDEKKLSYYLEIMGDYFKLTQEFITRALERWLPRMNDYQRDAVAVSMYSSLISLKNAGKNENMIKNSYVKFMCWLYYSFERVVGQLGKNDVPKILYEGNINSYELMLISILSGAGCDVVLLQYNGDKSYLSLDPGSRLSDELKIPNMTKFPETFNLKWIRNEIQTRINNERLYGQLPSVMNCTNAWIRGEALNDIRTAPAARGSDPRLFYNCFCRINGVEDKSVYLNDLYQFQLELKHSGRKLLIFENVIMQPTAEEVAAIDRKNYNFRDQMLADLSSKIRFSANLELQKLMHKAYIDVLLEASEAEQMTLNVLTNRAMYLLCWLKRYQQALFENWTMPLVSCVIYLGGCKNGNEALFFKLLSKLPTDILILVPNLNTRCVLTDKFLYEVNNNNSMEVNEFPSENTKLQLATAAYQAERDLDSLMYNDSGMYRNHQYKQAVSVTIRTMYEEIALLWEQELKFRPNFSTVDSLVNIPVIFAKVSGVKDGLVQQYWSGIKSLITEDTFVITSVPYINSTVPNPMLQVATEFFRNGKVQKSVIMTHPAYQYSLLRFETQNYILDKLQLLIDQRLINGTFVNGTEYLIVATVLNMQKDLLRLIQKFDFTKKNPKVIYVNTTDAFISLEDAILMAFLNLVGFDIVFFVPTGYQSVESHYSKKIMEEHQIGEYMYDLTPPNIGTATVGNKKGARRSWRDLFFKKGK